MKRMQFMKDKSSQPTIGLSLMGLLPSLSATLLSSVLLATTASAAPTVTVTDPATGQPVPATPAPEGTATPTNPNAPTTNAPTNGVAAAPAVDPNSLAAQLQPTDNALSAANQELLSRNAKLQREVNDLQTQVNVLIYESKGQMFLYGAFTVLVSLLVGIFVSWLVFVRRQRW